jgi:8-oxo-dGTP diphosphatase
MNRFNVRVYGIIENGRGEILVSTERRNGLEFTKFPGGGLEFGEGILDCLKRELNEELGIKIGQTELFYLTDFFQQSSFDKNQQLISVYYKVIFEACDSIRCSELQPGTQDEETFRWIQKNELKEELLTFPVDKIVAEMLRKEA